MDITITLPEDTALKDLDTVASALVRASADFIDFELMAEQSMVPVEERDKPVASVPGMILLSIGSQVQTATAAKKREL